MTMRRLHIPLIAMAALAVVATVAAHVPFAFWSVDDAPPPAITLTGVDIGSPPDPGSTAYDSGTGQYTIFGDGADVWGTSDQLHFAYVPLTGDATVTVRLDYAEPLGAWTKVGIMFRDTLDANAPNAFLAYTPANGIRFQWRDTAGGPTGALYAGAGATPVWLRLERTGNTFKAYTSSDGTTWTLGATQPVPLASSGYVGLAVCSHTWANTAEAHFHALSIQ